MSVKKVIIALSAADLKVLESTKTTIGGWRNSIASIWGELEEKKTLGNEITGKRRKRDSKYQPKKFG